MKVVVAAIAASIALPVVLVGAAAGALGSLGADTPPSAAAVSAVPAEYLALYQSAALQVCPAMSWTVLAAIGTVESDNGQSDAPGVHTGANTAGAEGPMQFEPATFAAYALPIPPGGATPPSPYDPTDAVYAAARDLCANGAGDPARLADAVYTYNHDPAYVEEVLDLAGTYNGTGNGRATLDSPPSAGPAGTAVAFALAQVGTPYRWGAEDPGVAFDCSGLVQAAYRTAGISLPRTAQAQFDAGPQLPAGTALLPGDLVFFGTDPTGVDHVGLVVPPSSAGAWEMVDAPHTGAAVRVETFPTTLDASWGAERYLGSTRPAAISPGSTAS